MFFFTIPNKFQDLKEKFGFRPRYNRTNGLRSRSYWIEGDDVDF